LRAIEPSTYRPPTIGRGVTNASLEKAILTAEQYRLTLTAPLDLTCDQKVVHWQDVDLDYTFVVFTMKKLSSWTRE
jgi:hypothetical protein